MYFFFLTKARELGLYMQKYCGCIFSEQTANHDHKSLKHITPNGYEYQKEPRLQVKRIGKKDDYMDMFLEADPSELLFLLRFHGFGMDLLIMLL